MQLLPNYGTSTHFCHKIDKLGRFLICKNNIDTNKANGIYLEDGSKENGNIYTYIDGWIDIITVAKHTLATITISLLLMILIDFLA